MPNSEPELRLTGVQFKNTVRDLIAPATDAYTISTFYQTSDMSAVMQSFPVEGAYDKGDAMIYDTQDQRILSPLLRSETSLVFNISQWLVADTTRLSRFVTYYAGAGNCPTTVSNTGMTQTCYEAFIRGFGLRALRRPVIDTNNSIDAGSANPAAANDLAFYDSIYTDAGNGGFDAVFAAMMLSPDAMFLNHIHGEGYSRLTLTDYETAAKLAYYFTDHPPDDQLYAAAAAGFQGTGNTLIEQANRLFNLPTARSRLTNFYSQWIRPAAIPALTAASNAPASVNLYSLRLNAIQELSDLAEYYTFGKPDGKLSDLFTSDISFAKTTDLAGIYNVPVWAGKRADGSYDPTALVHFPQTDPRAGIFTRAAYAFSGARDNNLIIRGARIRKDYMCENLVPPAAFTLSSSVPIVGPPTVRNIVIANTEVTGTNCASCHTPYINPLGFALENYDSFGRYRTSEAIYNTDGTLNSTVAVDASSAPFAASGDQTITNDGISFSQDLAANSAVQLCFAKHFFRFSSARLENGQEDMCRVNRLADTIKDTSGGTLANMIKNFATAADFQTRTISP